MPHRDPSHWQSLLWGRPVEFAQPRSVQDLVDARARRPDADERAVIDRTDIAAFHEDVAMQAEGDTPTADILVPRGDGPFPVFIHIHGGGWWTGSRKVERRFCKPFADAGFVVVNIDYALAPERPFPRGLEDCVYAARWVARNIERYGGDAGRVSIGGGSAGANLAAVTALALHGSDERLDAGDLAGVDVRFTALLLLFGMLDIHRWIAEPHYYAGGSEIRVMAYLGPNFTGRLRDPLVSPVESPHIDKLPPTYLSCGAEDGFLSHSLRMTESLANADVPVTLSVVADADHEFHKIPERVAAAGPENARIIEWLKAHARER